MNEWTKRIFGLLAGLGVTIAMAAAGQPSLTADGTEFVLTLDDGRILRSADLVGATLNIASGQNITIKSVEEEAVGGRVFLHHFTMTDATGKVVDLCTLDAQGRSLGFPVPDGHGGFELACTSGAIGKCILWGYRYWEEKPGGPPLRALHRACVHMVRADYGGDGQTYTREGVTIYVCDRFGVRPCAKDAPLAFEAAWGVEGAICVARPRISELISLEEIAKRYPRLKFKLGPATCTMGGAAHDLSALLLNRSQE
jgi:hypothetical protein